MTSQTKLVMMYDNRVPFGPEVEAINRAYAKARQYRIVVYKHIPDPNIDVYWNRLRVIQQELHGCEVLWWIDTDAFFLRTDTDLPAVRNDIAMSTDWNGVCCGVMAVRNTAWVHRFLDTWLLVGQVPDDKIKDFDNDQKREQTALKCLCWFFPNIAQHIQKFTDDVFQNPSAPYCPSALMLHMWASYLTEPRVFSTLKRFKEQGYLETTLDKP